MSEDLGFFIALMLNGLSIGLMYSLIALGFVLVYKSTDAINFAQGEFVMMAALIGAVVVAFNTSPILGAILAVLVVLAVMIGFGFGLERVVLRPLLGRPIVAVIMATIGLAAVLRGLTPIIFGGETRALPLPIPDDPVVIGPATLPPIQVLGAAVAIVLFAGFSWFFKKSRMGVAMRAVADNQQVAQAMGINVERYFALAWAMAGIVSALGGIVWGSMLGVDVQIAVVGLKVFPVVILGGLDSIGGAVVGGLIIGVVESLAAGYLDPYVGGGTKDFAPYLLMILVLMFRPYGIFGKRQIERV
ncbi:MAG: branched-chain amino acid ABC transporter permease [Reyranella sp.]|uniref:branched-chain amino acid ABC transporter permease n=1 Tax=Reyranella sp. TaxID=1929291 RepID=UPI001AC66E81|nr:branched-chain amino acid ABC transporter permease [Reyranella sp.]MBN9088510.1 branched-chain amino acid ABC transporter permease [Reyranella sp.]